MKKTYVIALCIVLAAGVIAFWSNRQDASNSIKTPEETATTSGNCYIGGCSAQICSAEKDIASTCEYREEYMCYKTAKCERQSNGSCGWTQTTNLTMCLKDEATVNLQ